MSSLFPDPTTPHETPPVKTYAGRVTGVEDRPGHVRIFRVALATGQKIPFRAGQYAELSFAGMAPRPYSIASAPHQRDLEFHIKSTGGGASAYATSQLRMGEEIAITAPFGHSWLRCLDRPVLAIGGGLGIAPLKAIVESALHHNIRVPVHLYFGARTADDLYLERHFLQLAQKHAQLNFIPVVQQEDDGTKTQDAAASSATASSSSLPHRHGNVGEVAAGDFDDLSGFQTYIAGPPAMARATADLLMEKSLPAGWLFSDSLPAPSPEAAPASLPAAPRNEDPAKA